MVGRMKIVGIITENFSVYYDLVKALKARSIPFVSLSFADLIPANVGVIITTEKETDNIEFEHKVEIPENHDEVKDIQYAINVALNTLSGKEHYNHLIIGIDPGKRPGVAVIGDGETVNLFQVGTPEDVGNTVRQILRTYPAYDLRIRIGHGAPTHRNRIINTLFDLFEAATGTGEIPTIIPIEIVDETSTTLKPGGTDTEAAKNIAFTKGVRVVSRYIGKYKIEPTEGELHDIQRRSRIESKGAVTISMDLAEKVAKGEFTLQKAILLQEEKNLGHS